VNDFRIGFFDCSSELRRAAQHVSADGLFLESALRKAGMPGTFPRVPAQRSRGSGWNEKNAWSPPGLLHRGDKLTYASIKVLLEPSPSRVARRGGLALQKWRAIPYGG
jgi:hypothetical protein